GSPPFKLQVHIHHKNLLTPPIVREFKLVVREPKDYVDPTAQYDPTKDELKVDVEAKATTFLGPHFVPLKLELSPEVAAKTKSLIAELTPDEKKVAMDAGELTFEKAVNEGDVHL